MNYEILFIERDEDLLSLTIDVLKDFGLSAQGCRGYHQAIEYIKSGEYKIVMSSHLLDKDKTAQDVFNQLRSKCNKTLFALLSGAPFEFERSFLNQVDLIIEKPYDVEEMCHRVDPLIKN